MSLKKIEKHGIHILKGIQTTKSIIQSDQISKLFTNYGKYSIA